MSITFLKILVSFRYQYVVQYRKEVKTVSNDTVYIPLRIPADLKQRIEELAKEDSRSFNQYVKVLLEKHVKEKDGQ